MIKIKHTFFEEKKSLQNEKEQLQETIIQLEN